MEYRDYTKLDFFSKEDQFCENNDVESYLFYGKHNRNAELTIVMPVYKRTTFIRMAIDSALHQKTSHTYEILIVDNTVENDDIFEIIKSYDDPKIVYYRNEKNLGMFGNWNRCIELSKTVWITMLHDDDMLVDTYVEEMLNRAGRLLDCSCLGALHDEIDENNHVIRSVYSSGRIVRQSDLSFYVTIVPVPIMGVMFKKKAAIEVGGFNSEFYPAADAQFLCKLQYYIHNIYLYQKKLVHYRIAENESMKLIVLKHFILYNHQQINAWYNAGIKINRNYHEIYQNIHVFDDIKSIMCMWNKNNEFDDIITNLEVGRISVLKGIFFRIFRKYLLIFRLHNSSIIEVLKDQLMKLIRNLKQ